MYYKIISRYYFRYTNVWISLFKNNDEHRQFIKDNDITLAWKCINFEKVDFSNKINFIVIRACFSHKKTVPFKTFKTHLKTAYFFKKNDSNYIFIDYCCTK